MMQKFFKLNDRVEWRSQSQGSSTKKAGTVISVVGPGSKPSRLRLFDDYKRWFKIMFDDSTVLSREEDSYLVKVDRGPGRKPALYWPRTSLLNEVSDLND